MARSLWITLLFVLMASVALAADDMVWQLRLKDGRPADCWLASTRVGQDEQNHLYLDADSRGDKGGWHSCVTLPKELLKAGQDYVVSLNYEVIARSGEGSYFYVFARSGQLGYSADKWEKWSGESGARGVAKLHVSPTADDFVITVGIRDQGAIRIRNLKVLHGNGWASVPLERVSGNAEPPRPPAGAQPFTVDAPLNPSGPVLNLADFGAVADGDTSPSSGPDRNHAAFVAAIAKCRETKASKLIVPKGVYRISSGETVVFEGLSDFVFDGGGSTFLYHRIKGGHGILIKGCTRTIFSNFNLDWDWKIDPLASVGRILKVAPDASFFEMRFEAAVPLDPKRWIAMHPLDEKLRVMGTGQAFGSFTPKKIDLLDSQTVRVWPSRSIAPTVGQLYLLRHYYYDKYGVQMVSNTHLSLQNVTIFSFPGMGFITSGDQHHFELLHCRITYPENEHRPITTTADGFHVAQSQGFIKLEDCDFGYMGDDCVNIHDNIHSGVRRIDDHTLIALNIVTWSCPFAAGDQVEIRNGDFSPTDFTGTVKQAKGDFKNKEVTLVFDQKLPVRIASDSILFNLRYASHNCIIRNCYFHENCARGILCNTTDWLIEGNRFFHNRSSALHLIADVGRSWSEGFGARNIIVRDNKFESLNCLGAQDGAAVYVSATINDTPSRYRLLGDIILENNVFTEMTGPAIEATSFKDLIIRNNRFINRDTAPINLKMRGSIRAELGSGLWVEGNEWITQKGIPTPTLLYDADTTGEIVCRGNHSKN